MVNNAKYMLNSLFDQPWYHSFIHAFLCVTIWTNERVSDCMNHKIRFLWQNTKARELDPILYVSTPRRGRVPSMGIVIWREVMYSSYFAEDVEWSSDSEPEYETVSKDYALCLSHFALLNDISFLNPVGKEEPNSEMSLLTTSSNWKNWILWCSLSVITTR